MRKPARFFSNYLHAPNNTILSWIFLVLLFLLPIWNACNNPITSTSTQLPGHFGFGRTATTTEITALDIDVRPDGTGLPPGSGSVTSGAITYEQKCASCHGKTGTEGPFNKLVGVMGDTTKAKTIGNYWPYATTIFDYIRRAMPYNEPGSLTTSEVYSLTAYLLYQNKIVDSTTALNARTLPGIKMPARDLFVNDDRQGGPEIK